MFHSFTPAAICLDSLFSFFLILPVSLAKNQLDFSNARKLCLEVTLGATKRAKIEEVS